jgi:thiol-disulfide isomerase/thioredoxin
MGEASSCADLPVRKVLNPAAPGLALALSFFALASCSTGEGEAAPPLVGAAPTTSIVGFDGLEAALAERRGSGYLLNFWAMWCAPCVAEMPELVEVGREYAERGGHVVGVSYDLMVAGADPATIASDVRAFLVARELDLSVLIYDEDDYDAVNERYGLPGAIPATLAIDAEGRVVDRQFGKADHTRFDEMMRKALGL